MKQKIFTLVMMLALVIVAGSAMAQDDAQHPFPGGTYHYALGGIYTSVDGTASISFTGFDVAPVITNASPEAFPMDIPTATHSLSFDLTFNINESAGANSMRVTIQNGVGGCSNYIDLTITVLSRPTIALRITGSTDIVCQNLVVTTLDNQDASVGATANTVTFTITPTPSPVALSGYTYDFHFELDDWTFGTTDLAVTAVSSGSFSAGTTGFDITGVADGAVTVTVSFNTTPGQAAQDFAATISTPVLHYSSVTYTTGNTITAPAVGANVSSVTYTPAIGTFTF